MKPLESPALPGAILAAYLVNLAVPSQSSTAAALGPILVPLLVLILAGPYLYRIAPNAIDLRALNAPPSAKHWFGTDGVGRDVLARLIRGGQISLLVAVPCLAWSMTRLLRSRRRWMDPVERARIVTTVAA